MTENMTENLTNILTAGCEQLKLSLSEEQKGQLLRYVQELAKWNKTYNLTALREPSDMMRRHVIDALSVVPHVREFSPQTLADIGTGGGVPGVILAIVFPELEVDLVESIGKKCRFLRYVVQQLGLPRVSVRQQRVEDWQPDVPRSIVICRAFTSLENFTTITQHLGDSHTHWLAMKSAHTKEEEAALPANFILTENRVLQVPFETAERRLLILNRQ